MSEQNLDSKKNQKESAVSSDVETVVRQYISNPMGHEWIKEDGVIDIFAYNPCDPHNGPRCKKCDYGFCHHCQDMPDKECTA